MSSVRTLLPPPDTRKVIIKWVVALLLPLCVFTFVWSGEGIVNNVFLGYLGAETSTTFTWTTLIEATIFVAALYMVIIALAGYLTAADSGRRGWIETWVDIVAQVVVPLLLVQLMGLIMGLAASIIVWGAYSFGRSRVRKMLNYTPPPPLASLDTLTEEARAQRVQQATAAGFWFATIFAVISLVADIIYYVAGLVSNTLLIWIVARTIILPIAGYFLGQLGGRTAMRRALKAKENGANGNGVAKSKERQLASLSLARAKEKIREIVPTDQPLLGPGAQRFYMILVVAFAVFYPVIDPLLFGYGTDGRLAAYGDAGYYVILALGLNIVVGFAGLLDLGYVAFFAIGSYVWGLFGSSQFQLLTGITVQPTIWGWLFWPMVIVAALIAALWGIILGAPTLRLRGDYLAIVTLGFGEIIPVIFRELDKYTNGINGIVGVYSPALPGVNWNSITTIPYYYLILALIVLCVFANIRLRDSRLGRAWIAIREDEIAASSSGINLVNTKLLAFGAGAFFSGIAGVYHAAKLGTVSPDNFNFSDSIIYLAMVVIGGLGSIPGVIVGAIAVYAINLQILGQLDTLAASPDNILHVFRSIPNFAFNNVRGMIFGIILVAIVIFRPEGLIPSARRKRELHHEEQKIPEADEGDALEEPPGAPDFEESVRVE
ncbi:branched-chain amino acid ABC transporter permease [Ktedonospora formicarum]|uniref:Branched-chain amino acid ABC transporter permease n=1 Tax=Ktedonospora formicarum TaxID=2778364 RepID=A0A8J3MNK0_9CHLR|nr:branched-chain amino acid ABC transporter permease [Ktedonospora formicarum]GHO42837.1 hypothetical protein KSX_10000 [Ktedonospora formicarum]